MVFEHEYVYESNFDMEYENFRALKSESTVWKQTVDRDSLFRGQTLTDHNLFVLTLIWEIQLHFRMSSPKYN